jgi:hypothetical protein
MKRFVLVLALLLGGFSLLPSAPALAGEAVIWRSNRHNPQPPFPLSERARSVWASGACWSDCGSRCTWALAGCLPADAQGCCLELADNCDRSCQRECRSSGGPLLPIDF